MGIFTKTTREEYNNKLEQILDNKVFDIESKNLLLSMVYKIENAYEDYYKIKPIAKTKQELMDKIFHIIEKECDIIEIVTPETKKGKMLKKIKQNSLLDIDEGKLTVYSNEKDLLYALIELDSEYNYFKYKDIKELSNIHNFLKKGEAMSISEIIRDFNGWSWNTVIKEIEDVGINLVYQNVIILLDEYVTIKNNPNVIKEKLLEKYEKQEINDFLSLLDNLIIGFNLTDSESLKTEKQETYTKNKELLNLMEDKVKFLEKVSNDKKNIVAKIKKIDKILNDKKLLQEEYDKRNKLLSQENKIFSLSHLASMVEEEREESLKELKYLNKLIDPKSFLQEKDNIQKECESAKKILELETKNSLEESLIKIQIEFLKCFKKKTEEAKTKEELKKLIYTLRYYCQIPINNLQQIKDIKELQEPLEDIMNILIDKSIEKRIIVNVSDSISLCYNTLKYLFFTRIIDLEKINVKIVKLKEQGSSKKDKYSTIEISLYDEKEEEEKYKETIDNLKMLNIRLNKRIPLFF